MGTRGLHTFLNEVSIKGKRSDKLAIFDLDDTLIISAAKIKVLNPKNGKLLKELTPAEFNFYTHNPKTTLSFKDFEDALEIIEKYKIKVEQDKTINYYKIN